jgi:hypothetical protein
VGRGAAGRMPGGRVSLPSKQSPPSPLARSQYLSSTPALSAYSSLILCIASRFPPAFRPVSLAFHPVIPSVIAPVEKLFQFFP